jgi:hypothetical protein
MYKVRKGAVVFMMGSFLIPESMEKYGIPTRFHAL